MSFRRELSHFLKKKKKMSLIHLQKVSTHFSLLNEGRVKAYLSWLKWLNLSLIEKKPLREKDKVLVTDKVLDVFRLKTYANKEINVVQKLRFDSFTVENIVG